MNARLRKRRYSAQSGQAIVIIAFAMVLLLIFLVLAIDGSKYYDNRRVTQNASDMAALAGMHYAWSNSGATDSQILAEIDRVGTLNGIPDSSDITAYWLADNGDYVKADNSGTIAGSASGDPQAAAQIPNSTSTKPDAAVGIRVRASWPYSTFFGHVLGQDSLNVQADGVSMRKTAPWTDPTIDYTKMSVWLGGGNCGSDPTFTVAANSNANSFDFGANAYINGSGTQGSGNSQQGLYKSGTGTASFSGSATGLTAGKGTVSTGWTNPYSPQQYPSWAYITVNGTKQLITAEDFNPDSSKTDNYVYKAYVAAGSSPANYFHSVSGSGPSKTAAQNGAALATAMSSGGPGIYYIDGDVDITSVWGDGQGLVATGVVTDDAGTGSSALGAANDSSGWGFGLSVFADGTPPAGKSACTANSDTDSSFYPIFQSNTEQANWSGIIFVPNGLFNHPDNGNGGHAHGPVIANAMEVANGGNANSIQFDSCSTCFVHPPDYVFNLQQ